MLNFSTVKINKNKILGVCLLANTYKVVLFFVCFCVCHCFVLLLLFWFVYDTFGIKIYNAPTILMYTFQLTLSIKITSSW